MFSSILSKVPRIATKFSVYRSLSTGRPFRILGVQQIAIGAEERSGLQSLWQDVFGLSASASKTIEKENVEEDILKLGPSPYSVEIDLMTPIDAEKSPKVSDWLYF